jgi:hypothetical protein
MTSSWISSNCLCPSLESRSAPTRSIACALAKPCPLQYCSASVSDQCNLHHVHDPLLRTPSLALQTPHPTALPSSPPTPSSQPPTPPPHSHPSSTPPLSAYHPSTTLLDNTKQSTLSLNLNIQLQHLQRPRSPDRDKRSPKPSLLTKPVTGDSLGALAST